MNKNLNCITFFVSLTTLGLTILFSIPFAIFAIIGFSMDSNVNFIPFTKILIVYGITIMIVFPILFWITKEQIRLIQYCDKHKIPYEEL